MSDERCCNGACRRKQPPMLMRGELTGVWYVVTRYRDHGEGRFEALEKHPLPARQQELLEAMRDPTTQVSA